MALQCHPMMSPTLCLLIGIRSIFTAVTALNAHFKVKKGIDYIILIAGEFHCRFKTRLGLKSGNVNAR